MTYKHLITTLSVLLLLSACSTGAADNENEISEEAIENRSNYMNLVSESIDESNKLLNNLSTSLDKVYTGEPDNSHS